MPWGTLHLHLSRLHSISAVESQSFKPMSGQDPHFFHWHYNDVDDKNFQLHGQSLLLILIVFSILLFFTLLCLYARWACRYRQSAASGGPQQQMASAIRSVGLDRRTIDSFPVYLHRSSESTTEAQCSICLSNFQEEEKVKVLPECHHSFHPECVDMWLRTHSNCPLCRASLGCSAEAAAEGTRVVVAQV